MARSAQSVRAAQSARRAGSTRRGALRLTRRGKFFLAAAAVCTIVAYGSGRTEFLYAACFLATLLLAALLLVRMRRRKLTVTRTFGPAVVSAGSIASVSLEVRNLGLSPSGPARWVDRIPWVPGVAGPGDLPPLAAAVPGYQVAGSVTTLRYSVRPDSRGIFPIGPLEVQYSDPFSLASGRSTLGGVQPLSVIPATSMFGDGGPSAITGEGAARIVQRRTTGTDDDLMTREYRSGDALRRVHWRASARHGELMVRQEEQRTFPEARLLLDTRADGYGDGWSDLAGNGGSADFEWAVRMVASLGAHLHRSGFLVEVIETAPQQLAPLGNANQGSGQDVAFLVSLASVHPIEVSGPSTPSEALGNGPVFAVLAETDPETLRWIIGQRRGYELGVAFVIGDRTRDSLAELTRAGWICVAVRESDDPAQAWASVPRVQAQAGAQ